MNLHAEIKQSSFAILRLCKPKHMGNANPLPDRKTNFELNKLIVGFSIWVDMDFYNSTDISDIRKSVLRYNNLYDDIFVVRKNREGLQKSGFKWLEIGRIK